jgi:peptide/nickel transport system permease protein
MLDASTIAGLIALTTGLGVVWIIGPRSIPWKYAIRKVLLAIPLVMAVVTFIFILLELAPGDASTKFLNPDFPPEVRDMVIAKYGLDKPVTTRYFIMMGRVLTLDFGRSITAERPVWDLVAAALPNTVLLSTVTLAVSYPLGILLGIVQAVRQGKREDTAISVGSLLFYSMPSFWLAMMLQLFVAYYLSTWITGQIDAGSLPAFLGVLDFDVTGMNSNEIQMAVAIGDDVSWLEWAGDIAHHLILPGVAMGVAGSAGAARYMRSSLLEVIRQDYIRTARAKGLPERVVILRHGMRNALLPIITLFGLSIPFLFSGSVLVEQVFSWPGMGQLIIQSIFDQDTPTIIACFFVSTLLVVAGNILADVSYAMVDPRIRYD